MTLRNSDFQSVSDLDSNRNSCDIFLHCSRTQGETKGGWIIPSCRQVWRLDSSLSWPVFDWKQNLSRTELCWPRSLDKGKDQGRSSVEESRPTIPRWAERSSGNKHRIWSLFIVIFVMIQRKIIFPVSGWSYIESWGGILSSVPPMQVRLR